MKRDNKGRVIAGTGSLNPQGRPVGSTKQKMREVELQVLVIKDLIAKLAYRALMEIHQSDVPMSIKEKLKAIELSTRIMTQDKNIKKKIRKHMTIVIDKDAQQQMDERNRMREIENGKGD